MSAQDTLTRGGYLEHAPKTPFILGGEVAGEIVGLGDKVNEFKVCLMAIVRLPIRFEWM
jgi:NADPH:quinone reductase-like Zn-dependent oxidoreductase